MIQCPKCSTNKNIKWFLRHQNSDSDLDNEANVITILCTECGENESLFLKDCLEDIFLDWSDKKDNKNNLFSFFDLMSFENEEGDWPDEE